MRVVHGYEIFAGWLFAVNFVEAWKMPLNEGEQTHISTRRDGGGDAAEVTAKGEHLCVLIVV
jgi:hypothetical protein